MNEIYPSDNASFKYGIGLVETMRCNPLIIFLGKQHYQRLVNSLDILNMKNPFNSYEHFEQTVLEQIDFNISELYRIRVQIYPKKINYFSNEISECNYHIQSQILQIEQKEYSIGFLQNVSKSYDTLSALKTSSMLPYYLGSLEANKNNWDDGILINNKGNIVETTIANIFSIKNNTIYTPPITDGAIKGIFRDYILEKFSVKEMSITPSEILEMDSVFLTNSLRGVMPVKYIGEKEFDLEPIIKIKNKLQS